ncbi:hypothetical protein GHK92_15065 [Nocardioides sp. dk4132]|uniref:hypothetical protein n=1 Tax=unclassified Nocardioides TaxID=2615069 RepID=UPI001297F1CF|nr:MULTISPECIES: hypothetical protein [unclassified Nocardioides]MQW77192.1 hypothetical protein [Nocardioides sp. dk4132]QGA07957.1 hypothetical protein GFH29_11545 [Nocardioides sp. dk884]
MGLQLNERMKTGRWRTVGAACVSLLFAAGCGAQAGVEAPSSAEVVADVRSDLAAWSGTLEDRQAAEVVTSAMLNKALDDCLADRGFDRFDWKDSIFPVTTPNLLNSPWLIGPEEKLFSAEIELAARATRVEEQLNNPPERPAEEVRAEDECLAPGVRDSASDSEVAAVTTPAGLVELEATWGEHLAEGLADLGDVREFTRCVEDQKSPALNGRRLEDLDLLANERATSLGLDDGDLRGLQEFRAWELSVVEALRACVEPQYDDAVTLLAELSTSFHERHRAEVENLEQHWSKVRKDADVLAVGQ